MEHDPYLDKSLSEEQLSTLKQDLDANIIFARQDYKIKEGGMLNLDPEKCYLFLNANEEFLKRAEPKLLKSIEGIKRAASETEGRVLSSIDNEISNSEAGIGSIFG
jgi:hypothetical protein